MNERTGEPPKRAGQRGGGAEDCARGRRCLKRDRPCVLRRARRESGVAVKFAGSRKTGALCLQKTVPACAAVWQKAKPCVLRCALPPCGAARLLSFVWRRRLRKLRKQNRQCRESNADAPRKKAHQHLPHFSAKGPAPGLFTPEVLLPKACLTACAKTRRFSPLRAGKAARFFCCFPHCFT